MKYRKRISMIPLAEWRGRRLVLLNHFLSPFFSVFYHLTLPCLISLSLSLSALHLAPSHTCTYPYSCFPSSLPPTYTCTPQMKTTASGHSFSTTPLLCVSIYPIPSVSHSFFYYHKLQSFHYTFLPFPPPLSLQTTCVGISSISVSLLAAHARRLREE